MTENFSASVAFRWLLVFALSIHFTNSSAQKTLTADTIGASYADILDKSYALSNETFLTNLKEETEDRKLLKYYQTNFKEIFAALHVEIKDRQMAYVTDVSTALEKMVKEIQTANAAVPQDIRLVLVRDNLPNAYTLGDNTIFVNMGLFYYLQNEDQVAGVLAHEIGHLLKRHTIKALNYNYEKDKEATLDVKAIRENKEKKADRAFDALKTAVYKKSIHRRKHELQADSVGYVLFKNTRYRAAAFTEALEILDRYDTIRPEGLMTETFKRFFDIPGQAFNEKWMKVEDFTSYKYGAYAEKFDKDSLLTHPKGPERIGRLVRAFPELAQKNVNKEPTEAFKKVKATAESERLLNLYTQEKYGEAVYMCLLYLQEKPNDNFYRSWLGRSFEKIYEARKGYTLNKYLDQVDPKDQSESYIQFLSFMWNLKLDEIKNIAAFYNKAHQ